MTHELPPFPSGWYFLAVSADIAAGRLVTKHFAGEDMVLYRTASGKLNAVHAYCPHMGAHFGFGGTVEGENLRCPFHGFEFNTEGTCVRTGYNTKPPAKCTLPHYPVLERDDMVLVWIDKENREPDWQPPAFDNTGFGDLKLIHWNMDGHPQETTENSVDIGHFTVVHGYESIEILKPVVTEGPYLNARYAMHRHAGQFGQKEPIRAEFEVHVWGLGYSYVDVTIPRFGLTSRQYVLPQPMDAGKLRLTVGMRMQRLKRPAQMHPALALLPNAWANRLVGQIAFKAYYGDVMQDFEVWKNKKYVMKPMLAQGDGPIIQYRRWAAQFYPPVTSHDMGLVATN